ncbi:hypothetical protein MKW92_041369 [Papaver armeniacum]|nr:hypothetical protein MKW92_041369 [Papaver armeniacum]
MASDDQQSETTKACLRDLSEYMKHCKQYTDLLAPKRPHPLTDIKILDDKYEYIMDVPEYGFWDKLNARIENNNELVIEGKRRFERLWENLWLTNPQYLKKDERKNREFSRTYRLPENANPKKVKAEKKHGMLTVTVEKYIDANPEKPKVIAKV